MKLPVLLIAATLALAQERPAFEAASVKLNTSGTGEMSMRGGRGTLEWQNTSLRHFVQVAYRLHDYDYSAPAWLDSVRLDVVARVPANGSVNQYPEMLQTMLAERFKLAVHREIRELPGLALVVDKKGLRIHTIEPGGSMLSSGPTMVQAQKATMKQFADALASALNRPVQDLTGLSDSYDIKIQWTADLPSSTDPTDLPGSVYAAVQELGLRLQVRKVPVEVLIVESAECVPTEN
jgi:uncharacterized protein (TIGR03435 family)